MLAVMGLARVLGPTRWGKVKSDPHPVWGFRFTDTGIGMEAYAIIPIRTFKKVGLWGTKRQFSCRHVSLKACKIT